MGKRTQSSRALKRHRANESSGETRLLAAAARPLEKCKTGIAGFDAVTLGGLPRGRPSLVCGSAGCGKTLMAVEFLVRGAMEFGEPGVLVTFEETEHEIAENVRSLGFDLEALVRKKLLFVDYVHIDRNEIEESGSYDLEALFLRLADAVERVGARRVVLDTIENLFGGLSNAAVLRSELRRLFRWLKDRQLTAMITGERGDGQLTRQGLEEYVSDCVILLDHRVVDQVSTRRLRIVKYRGSTHGTNEYPFLIDERGFSVLPVTSAGLEHEVSNERISTGVARLDTMLDGKGLFRGTSVLVTGTAGTGKSSLGAAFVDAACARGERAAYFSFEESPKQIVRNMRSIGLDLQRWVERGLLRFVSARPSVFGLEAHLATMHATLDAFSPRVAAFDPISSLQQAGTHEAATGMLVRLVDHLKSTGVTALFTDLTNGSSASETTESTVSSLMDTWLLLRNVETSGERNRLLYVLKSRGMAHSNQVREFRLTGKGIDLIDVASGAEGVLTGSARIAKESAAAEAEIRRRDEIAARERMLERKRASVQVQIASLEAELASDAAEIDRMVQQERKHREQTARTQAEIARARWADDVRSPDSSGGESA